MLLNAIDVHRVITRDLETASVTMKSVRHCSIHIFSGQCALHGAHFPSFSHDVIHLYDNQSNHNRKLILYLYRILFVSSFFFPLHFIQHGQTFVQHLARSLLTQWNKVNEDFFISTQIFYGHLVIYFYSHRMDTIVLKIEMLKIEISLQSTNVASLLGYLLYVSSIHPLLL